MVAHPAQHRFERHRDDGMILDNQDTFASGALQISSTRGCLRDAFFLEKIRIPAIKIPPGTFIF